MDREALRETFDGAADLYDAARPGYPDELFHDLAALAELQPGARVLEVGCGTGQATRELAVRGYDVTCVELGERLAAIASRNVPTARVHTTAFETWETRQRFDAVFAATAWHWLNPELRYGKAARVLTDRGVLAIVTTEHAFPADSDPFFAEIQEVYVALGEARAEFPAPEEVPDLREEIDASGLFEIVAVCRYTWAQAYTAGEYIAVLNTYSGHRLMPPEHRERLFGEIRSRVGDGLIRKHYLNILHVARRRRATLAE